MVVVITGVDNGSAARVVDGTNGIGYSCRTSCLLIFSRRRRWWSLRPQFDCLQGLQRWRNLKRDGSQASNAGKLDVGVIMSFRSGGCQRDNGIDGLITCCFFWRIDRRIHHSYHSIHKKCGSRRKEFGKTFDGRNLWHYSLRRNRAAGSTFTLCQLMVVDRNGHRRSF